MKFSVTEPAMNTFWFAQFFFPTFTSSLFFLFLSFEDCPFKKYVLKKNLKRYNRIYHLKLQAGPLKFTKNNNETYDIENNVEFS